MNEALYELLAQYVDSASSLSIDDTVVRQYLKRLETLRLSDLNSAEPQSLSQFSHSTVLSLQALCSRSSKPLITSTDHLNHLAKIMPAISRGSSALTDSIATLDESTLNFANKYSKSCENVVLEGRKRALLVARNSDRLHDVLDLPTLLSSAISSSAAATSSYGSNYASALDLHSHIKRLYGLYSDSALLNDIHDQSELAIDEMISKLLTALRAPAIKLATAMRTIGWLQRLLPDLARERSQGVPAEGSFGTIFLVSRLANLTSMLEALAPLRDLADQESERRIGGQAANGEVGAWAGGQQTERYLKRYIEIFREQSFSIISMFRSIFPDRSDQGEADLALQFQSVGLKSPATAPAPRRDDLLGPMPSAIDTFPQHLTQMLATTLNRYLSNVRDRTSRESLLTQVLYCSGSLGRLGGDFSMLLTQLDPSALDSDDWVMVMKKHRDLAGRLEQLASTAGSERKWSTKSPNIA